MPDTIDVDDSDLEGLSELLEAAARKLLSAKRFEHSRGCSAFSAEACARAGIDPRKGRAAGWAHDLAKELPRKLQKDLARDCPVPVPGSVFKNPALYHGPAAAALLDREYGVRDRDILEAVALHTVGRPDMGFLAKIVWAADKLEPGRRHVDQEFREHCKNLDPDSLLLEALKATIVWLELKGREVAPETLDLYNALRKEYG